MRIRHSILLLLASIFFASSAAYAQDTATPAKNFVAVYYFHTNFRCVNCYNMEKWTKEVVDTSFKDDKASGKLVMKIINTETKGNEHFMTDYQLYTKSVVLALVKDGKEVKFTNLAKVWDYLRSCEKFESYVRDEISKYLKEL